MNLTQLINEEKKKITSEIYTDPRFVQKLQTMADSVLVGTGSKAKVNVGFDFTSPNTVAYTTGDYIYINAANSVSNHYELLNSRTLAIFGLLFHETAHIRYLDFAAELNIMNELADNGVLHGDLIPATKADEPVVDEIQAALSDTRYRGIFSTIYHTLSNTFSDVHDEGKMCNTFHGIVERGIIFAAESMRLQAVSIEKMKEEWESGDFPGLSVMFSVILEYARYGGVVINDPDTCTPSTNVFLGKLERLKGVIDKGCSTDSLEEKFTCINSLLIELWPFIQELLQETPQSGMSGGDSKSDTESSDGSSGDTQQSGASQGNGGSSSPESGATPSNGDGDGSSASGSGTGAEQGSDSGQNTENGGSDSSDETDSSTSDGNDSSDNNQAGSSNSDKGEDEQSAEENNSGSGNDGDSAVTQSQINKVMNALKQAMNSSVPNAAEQPNLPDSQPLTNEEPKTDDSEHSVMDESMAQAIAESINQSVAKELARERAEEKIESRIQSDTNVVIKTVDLASAHKGLKVHIERYSQVTDADKRVYNMLMQDLRPISKALQRQMLNALRDLTEGEVMRHKVFGNKLEMRDSYRLDGKCFSKKKAPQDLPDMAIVLLIDQSGSTSGERIRSARRAAMMLDDFATGLGIPTMIMGHTDHRVPGNIWRADGVSLYPFADFERVSGKEKYRLVNIQDHNAANRDGMAINIAAELLARRPETVKLLIVISDGQPASTNYGGQSAVEDIQSIVKKYRKKGVQTIATAIGDDKERIKEIYKDGYIDISDLNKFPKALVKIVKKRII